MGGRGGGRLSGSGQSTAALDAQQKICRAREESQQSDFIPCSAIFSLCAKRNSGLLTSQKLFLFEMYQLRKTQLVSVF